MVAAFRALAEWLPAKFRAEDDERVFQEAALLKMLHDKPIVMEGTREGVEMEIAVQYNDSYSETVFCFANNINTKEGGTHLVGFKAALTRTINNYANANDLLKKETESLTGDDMVTFQAGTHDQAVTITLAEYRRIAQPEMAHFARPM